MKEDYPGWATFILGLVSLFLLYKSADIGYSIYRMKDWRQVEAQVLSSSLDINKDDEVDTYRSLVSYQYPFEGKRYQGDRIGFGYMHSNMDRHVEVADKLKYAKRIKVWVDPLKPEESAIAQGWNQTAVFFLCFSLLWTGIVGGSILWSYGENSVRLRALSKTIFVLISVFFLLLLVRLVYGNLKEGYLIKLEDKIEVVEYMTEKEIRKEKQLEGMLKEAFRRAEAGEDTVRFQLEKDTIHIKLN